VWRGTEGLVGDAGRLAPLVDVGVFVRLLLVAGRCLLIGRYTFVQVFEDGFQRFGRVFLRLRSPVQWRR
jgi:hypothetical protein